MFKTKRLQSFLYFIDKGGSYEIKVCRLVFVFAVNGYGGTA